MSWMLDATLGMSMSRFVYVRDFNPKPIVGIDIEPKLIAIARKNCNCREILYIKTYSSSHPYERQFPIFMPLIFGSINL